MAYTTEAHHSVYQDLLEYIIQLEEEISRLQNLIKVNGERDINMDIGTVCIDPNSHIRPGARPSPDVEFSSAWEQLKNENDKVYFLDSLSKF